MSGNYILRRRVGDTWATVLPCGTLVLPVYTAIIEPSQVAEEVVQPLDSVAIVRLAREPERPVTVIRGHRGYSHGCVCGGESVTASNVVFRASEFSKKYIRGDSKVEPYKERDRSWKHNRNTQHRNG